MCFPNVSLLLIVIGQFLQLGYFSFSCVFPQCFFAVGAKNHEQFYLCFFWITILLVFGIKNLRLVPPGLSLGQVWQIGYCLGCGQTLQKIPRTLLSSQGPGVTCTLWILPIEFTDLNLELKPSFDALELTDLWHFWSVSICTNTIVNDWRWYKQNSQ